MKQEVIFRCEFTEEKASNYSYATSTTELDCICKYVLKHHRNEILNAISSISGINSQNLDERYNGGIDSWFGPGSVMLYELGLAVRFTFGPADDGVFEILSFSAEF